MTAMVDSGDASGFGMVENRVDCKWYPVCHCKNKMVSKIIPTLQKNRPNVLFNHFKYKTAHKNRPNHSKTGQNLRFSNSNQLSNSLDFERFWILKGRISDDDCFYQRYASRVRSAHSAMNRMKGRISPSFAVTRCW